VLCEPMHRTLVFLIIQPFLISSCSYEEDSRDRAFALDDNLFNEAIPMILLKKDSRTLAEASGLAISRENRGRYWTHNDSGDGPYIYLFDGNGEVEATVTLDGVEARDWEEISTQVTDSVSYLYIGDIGDNDGSRDSIMIHRIKEPKVGDKTKITISKDAIETMVIQYAEGARDAESLFYDSIDDNLVLITKREQDVLVYEFQFKDIDTPVAITSKGSIPMRNITSADVLPGGDILLKNYDNVFYWKRKNKAAYITLLEGVPFRIPYVKEPQGEAICTDEAGNFYTVSERSNHAKQEVFFYERKLAF
jgi:hypothetical protein